MAAVRANKLSGPTRTAKKRRKASLSPEITEMAEDEHSISPKKLDKATADIHDYLDELESLRSKSSNLNGKISSQIRKAIVNIRDSVVIIATKAKEAVDLKPKYAQLELENRALKEKLTAIRNAENDMELDDNMSDFQTPRASTSRRLSNRNLGEQRDSNLFMRKASSQGCAPFFHRIDEEEIATDLQEIMAPPDRMTYAESLRMTGKSQAAAGISGTIRPAVVQKPSVPPPSIIRVRGNGIPYDQLVSKIKTGVNPTEYEITVLSLRKSLNGELEIRANGEEEKITRFKEAIARCIGEAGSTRKMMTMAFIHISDLESEIKETEIADDICKLCNLEPENVKVTSLRPAYGFTQKATVKLPKKEAEKLQEIGRAKIGYVSCRIQIREFERRCFRCGENGHVASNCKGPDRNGQCFRCGSGDHKIQGCPDRNVKKTYVPPNQRESE